MEVKYTGLLVTFGVDGKNSFKRIFDLKATIYSVTNRDY